MEFPSRGSHSVCAVRWFQRRQDEVSGSISLRFLRGGEQHPARNTRGPCQVSVLTELTAECRCDKHLQAGIVIIHGTLGYSWRGLKDKSMARCIVVKAATPEHRRQE